MPEPPSERPNTRRVAASGRDMQTFVLAQAVIEHSTLSSMSTSVSTGIGDVRYQLGALVESLDATKILIGLGIVVLIMVFWRR